MSYQLADIRPLVYYPDSNYAVRDLQTQEATWDNAHWNDPLWNFSGAYRVNWSNDPNKFTAYCPYATSTLHGAIDKRLGGGAGTPRWIYCDAPGERAWSPDDGARIRDPWQGADDPSWIGQNWWWLALVAGAGALTYYLVKKRR